MPRVTVIVDTVGFIRKLPHDLVASFRSTMEEAAEADLVLHVIDHGHPQFEEQREVGEQVLADLNVDHTRVIDVLNKADRVAADGPQRPRRNIVSVSALTGRGIDGLVEAIRERELEGGETMRLEIPHEEARTIAKLHNVAVVLEQSMTDDAAVFTAWVPRDCIHMFSGYAAATLVRSARVS